VEEGLADGIEAGILLREGLIAGMAQVGKLYEEGEIFVPEMLVAARAMTAALSVRKPHLVEEGVASSGKVAIGTTQGDLHDIGKNLVAMMLEGSGYEIVDLASTSRPRSSSRRSGTVPNVVAMSALLTTTMTNMQLAIQAITEAGLRDRCASSSAGAHHQVLRGRDRGRRLRGGRLQCGAPRERGACRLNVIRDWDQKQPPPTPGMPMPFRVFGRAAARRDSFLEALQYHPTPQILAAR